MYLGEEPAVADGILSIGPEIEVQLDQFDEMYIDYPLLRGQSEGTANLHEIIGISASDLLFVDDEEELEDLAYLVHGKIALIGEVAEVAHDEFETPVGNVFGVEVIANSISTLLRGGPLKAASLGVELLLGFLLLAVFLGSPPDPGSFSPETVSALPSY